MVVAQAPFDLAETKLAAPLGPTRHGAEGGPGRGTVRVVHASGDGGRARRVRQDDPSRELGRGRFASVRVGRARQPGRRRRWCSCDTSQPRFIESNRSRPRCSTRCRAQGLQLANASRASARALAALDDPLVLVLDDLHTVTNPACLDVLAELVPVRPGRLADRGREQGRAGTAACTLAGSGAGARDRSAGSPLDEREAELLLEAAGVELDADELSELTERTEGWPAGLYLAALSLQAGRRARRPGELSRRRPVRGGVLPPRASVPATGGRRRASSSTPPCWSVCLAACATPCSRRAVGRTRSRRSSGRTASSCRLDRRRRVVPLPPPVRRAAAERARTQRAGRGGRTQPPRDGLVHREWPDGSRGRLRARRGRDGHCRRLARGLALPRTTTGGWRPLEEWLGWFGDDELAQYPALAVYGAWIAC